MRRIVAIRVLLFAVAISVFWGDPVFAEVCDKEMPNWDPADGPATAFDALLNFIATPINSVFLGTLFVAFWVRALWLSLAVAMLGWVFAALILYDWLRPHPVLDDIRHSAIREGCFASPILVVLMLAIAGAVLLAVTFKTRFGRSLIRK